VRGVRSGEKADYQDKILMLENILKDTIPKKTVDEQIVQNNQKKHVLEAKYEGESSTRLGEQVSNDNKGIIDYILPKAKKTLMKVKGMLLYHSYSSDDIRYTISIGCDMGEDNIDEEIIEQQSEQ